MSAPYSICHDHTGVLLVVRGDGFQRRELVRTAEEYQRARASIVALLDVQHRGPCNARLFDAYNRHLEAAMDRIAQAAPHDTEAP